MNNLPNEILNKIFIMLPINQKQECLFVCKKWENVIRNQSLFHTLHIDFSSNICERFIRLVKSHPELALQVQELTLMKELDPEYNIIEFLRLFPNLKIVKDLRSSLFYGDKDNQTTDAEGNHRWKYFSGIAIVSVVKWILKSPSTIVSLILRAYRPGDILDNRIITLLKNAPLLNHLCIAYATIIMNQFEAIHNNTPALKSLELYYCRISSHPDTMKTNVDSADNITALNFEEIRFSKKAFLDLHQYIGRKYPNLKAFNQSMIFSPMFGPTNHPLLIKGYSKVVQQSLRSIDLLCEDDMDQFKSTLSLLDVCHIQTVRIFSPTNHHLKLLSECKQSGNIENLEFYYNDERIQLGKWVKTMKALKSLKFYYDFDMIHPDDFRSETLRKTGIDLIDYLPFPFNRMNFKYGTFSTIEELQLAYHRKHLPDLQAFINTYLPNLHILNLFVYDEVKYRPFKISLEFPRHHFTSIHILTKFDYLNWGMQIESKGIKRFYVEKISCKCYSLLGEECIQVSEDQVPNIHLTLMCGSVEKLCRNLKTVFH